MCHSSTGLLGCGCIGSHHRSGVATEDCTLQSEEENKFMVDGPNVGLEGVTVYKIEANEMS